ncbi:MAG: molybdate ABC transporter substrate-binding protein [Gallionella sp.]
MSIVTLRRYIAAVLLSTLFVVATSQAGEVRVAVSSNFAVPMQRIAEMFQHDSGHTVKITAAATGKLYARIVAGEPFDVFLAADEDAPKRLTQDGIAVSGSRFVYAEGKLALWSVQPDLVDAKGAVLRNGNFAKLAIANYRFSPYGVAAKQTLEKLAMWNGLQRKLTKGDDTVHAYELAASENADLAFIAISQLRQGGKPPTKGSWWIVPDELHAPIRQSAVLLTRAKDNLAAQALLDFLKGKRAATVIREFGYELP